MPRITDIKPQEHSKERFSVFIDGEYSFSILKEVLIKHRLNIGQEISLGELSPILSESENKSAFLKGLNYVSKKACACLTARDYLIKKGYNKEAAENAVARLKEYRYLNDEEYAKNYVELNCKGKGRLKAKFELKNKGIDEDIIQKHLNNDENELENCIKEAQKFIKNKKEDISLRQKLYNHLLYRGFDRWIAADTVNTVLKGNNGFEYDS